MKILSLITFFLLLPQILFAQNQRKLPDVFFIKCELKVPMYGNSWLIKIDRKNKRSEFKTPVIDNDFKICKEDIDQILIKKDCTEKQPNEFKFNKWNGSISLRASFRDMVSKKSCEILDKNQKPLYK